MHKDLDDFYSGDLPFKIDQIGYWSELKHDIIKKYAKQYSVILSKQTGLYHLYIDAFAGSGINLARRSGAPTMGSPLNALEISPEFQEYHFIDLDQRKIDFLKKIVTENPRVFTYNSDCNDVLLNKIFPMVTGDKKKRALCLLDPYGLHLDWQVVQTAGRSHQIEVFLNFPILDINLNLMRQRKDLIGSSHRSRMNRFWGDSSWEDTVYSADLDLFGSENKIRIGSASVELVEAFRSRLKVKAGFTYVPKPVAMKNSRGGIVYYLFFASPNKTADKIVRYIFKKYNLRQA